MNEIVTIFPLFSTHVNLIDDEWCERLLPVEPTVDPKEGIFLYASKSNLNFTKPAANLVSEVVTPLGHLLPTDVPFNRTDITNLAFLARYLNKRDDMVVFRFDIFAKAIAEPLLLMRLFAPGDIFVTHALPSGYEALKLSSDFEDVQDFYFLDQKHLPIFKTFFQDFWKKLRIIEPYTKRTGSVASWSKRIGNALYFFNKSYFTKIETVGHRNARNGNIDRLMALITALDALFGITASGDKLAENTDCLLKYSYKDVEARVSEFYNLRSNWIHANEQKLDSGIADDQIRLLSRYVQKACLMNIELFCDDSVRDGLQQSQKKHSVQYLQSIPEKLQTVAETIMQSGQIYDERLSNILGARPRV
ncbi:MAG: hypothetical protein ABH820_03035 [Patescibacteria group bacterium]